MYRNVFPGCCTASILASFPYDNDVASKFVGLRSSVVAKAKAQRLDGDAVLMATVTTQQEKVRAILMDIGFICSEPMKKKRHQECDLYVLYLPLAEWAKANTKQVPRDAKGRFIKANPFK